MAIALRLTIFLLLAAAALLPAARPAGTPVATGDAVIGSAAEPPPAFVRREMLPPTPGELERLAALAHTAPLFAAQPAPPRFVAIAPASPRASRNAALDWRLLDGTPGATSAVQLADAGGILNNGTVTFDGSGTAAGAFRVRPERSGWHAWTVSADGQEAGAGAWVLPPDTLRILVAGTTGSIEDREVARALERSGAAVTLAADLGRGLALGNAPAGLPARATDMRAWDVIIVLAGVAVDSLRADALRDFIAGGGGVAVAGAAAGYVIPGILAKPADELPAATLRWAAPAEIEPLPALENDVPVADLQADDQAAPAARLGDAAVLRLGATGRGRWAALGLTETWRWGLEAGQIADLDRFWASLAGWLAGGAASDIAITVDPATAPRGLPVSVHLALLDTTAAPPERIYLHSDTGTDSAAIAWAGERGTARFIAAAAGPIEVRLQPDGPAVAGHFADPEAQAATEAWARLGRIAAASGGALLPPDSLDARLPPASGSRVRTLLVLLAAVAAMAEWARRRFGGRA